MKEHRFLNFNAADNERRKMQHQGVAVSQIIHDSVTGGYIFMTSAR